MKTLTPILVLAVLLAGTPVVATKTYAASAIGDNKARTKQSPEEEQAMVARALDELLTSMKVEDFTYNVNQPDPFLPFISAKAAQSVQAVPTEHLTGMRKYEPGQLKLVAIVFSRSRPMAMVQDSAGKGYVIRRGTRIGNSGIVSDIIPNKVVIKQLVYSITKKKKYKTVEMVIRKEGEK